MRGRRGHAAPLQEHSNFKDPTEVIYLASAGLPRADFVSEEGVQQGDGPASMAFCAGIHPEVQGLDAILSEHGGAARFIMDDGYAVGPPAVVFDAVRRFGEAITHLGLELQETKSECYCPAGPDATSTDRPEDFPLGTCRAADGTVTGFGILVGGVPVGDTAYVRQCLSQKAATVVSKVNTVSDVLRPLHLQALQCCTYYGLNSLFHHWVRHCLPEDVLEAACQVDSAVLRVARACHGDAVTTDPYAAARLRLPARMYGGGLRSAADVAPAAFLGALCQTIPRMLPRTSADGDVCPVSCRSLWTCSGQDHSTLVPKTHALPRSSAGVRGWLARYETVGKACALSCLTRLRHFD